MFQHQKNCAVHFYVEGYPAEVQKLTDTQQTSTLDNALPSRVYEDHSLFTVHAR